MDLLDQMAGIPIIPKQCPIEAHELIHFELIWLAGWKTQIFLSTIRTPFFQECFFLDTNESTLEVFPKKCTWKWIDVWNGCQIIYLRSNNGTTLIVPPTKRRSPTLLYWLLWFFSCRPAPCGCGVLSINWMVRINIEPENDGSENVFSSSRGPVFSDSGR